MADGIHYSIPQTFVLLYLVDTKLEDSRVTFLHHDAPPKNKNDIVKE